MALTLPILMPSFEYNPKITTIEPKLHQTDLIDQYEVDVKLPGGFPKQLSSDLVWSGSQLSSDQYIYHLTSDDKLEVKKALTYFKELHIDGDLVNCQNFPLPNLSPILRTLSTELHNGKGFFLLRGLDYDTYSVEDNTIIFLGMQSFIAEKKARQDHLGNMIGDQIDPGHFAMEADENCMHIIADSTSSSPPLRKFHTRHSKAKISFHTDNIGDVLAFQTRSTASRGGNAVLSSAYAIYNELAASRPDIIRVLAEPNWPIACPSYHERPILFHHASHIIFNFFNGALLGSQAHPRPSDLPQLLPSQISALYILQDLAEKHRLSIPLQVGDIHFVNNLAVLHRRDAFEVEPGNKRHLVRMWVKSMEHAWALPAVLKEECGWSEAFGERGEDEGRDEVWHIEPMPHLFFPLRKYGN